MMFKRIILFGSLLALISSISFAETANPRSVDKTEQESDQQINGFSLTGYGEKGKKNWDLAGKSADIFADVVKLKDVIGNMYGDQENIKLTADKGDFSKSDGKVHLQDNVVITTSSGIKLTTDSLDWDRKGDLVSTKDRVNIERDNMTIVARGANGEPNLKKVALEKDVRLDINPLDQEKTPSFLKEKTVITCDGPLQVDYEKNLATFLNNVVVERPDSTIYSDKMDVYFIPSSKDKVAAGGEKPEGASGQLMGSKIDKIISQGNVKVVRGENTSYSQEAIYTAGNQKLTLIGRPRLIIYSQEGLKPNAPLGN